MFQFTHILLISILIVSSVYAVNPDTYPDFGEKARFIDAQTYDQERMLKPFFESIFDYPGDDEWMLTKIGKYEGGKLSLPLQPKSYWGVYGPYVSVQGGLYLGEIMLTAPRGVLVGKIDIVQRGYAHLKEGKPFQIIGKTDIKLREKTEVFRFRFRIPHWKNKQFDQRFEFRFQSMGSHPVVIHKMVVYPAQSSFVPKAPAFKPPSRASERPVTQSVPNPLALSDEQVAMILQAQEISDFRSQNQQTELQQAMMRSQFNF